MDSGHSLDEMFEAGVDIVQNLPKEGPITSSTNEKLSFYSLYKQATVGPCEVGKPAFWNVVEKYKWDAWKSLGQMSMIEAKKMYLTKLLQKIDYINEKYDTDEWMKGDLYDKLLPKFIIIGRPPSVRNLMSDAPANIKSEENPDVGPHNREFIFAQKNANEECPFPPTEIIPAKNAFCAVSDSEYLDAVDDEERQSRSSSFDVQEDFRKRRKKESLRTYCSRVEDELKIISDQIEKLSLAVERRHSMLIDMFKKATVYMFVPRRISWRTVLFFVFWPFITHFMLRYSRKYLRG